MSFSKNSLLMIVTTIITWGLNAQEPSVVKYKRFSTDVYVGVPVFYGDIENKFLGSKFTARFNYNITSALSFGGEFSFGKVMGSDTKNLQEYFTNDYLILMVGTEVYLLNMLKFSESFKFFQPFISLNFGGVKSDIEQSGNVETLHNRHYNNWDFAHQWNIGAKIHLTNWIDLNARYELLIMRTDKFDNYSPAVYANKHNDILTSFNLGITFHLGEKNSNSIIWKNYSNASNKYESDNALLSKVDLLEHQFDSLANFNNEKRITIKKPKEFPIETLSGAGNYKYYIVVSSYASLEKVNKKVYELKVLGYQPFVMVNKARNIKRVVIDASDDIIEIKQKLKYFKLALSPTVWIIQQK